MHPLGIMISERSILNRASDQIRRYLFLTVACAATGFCWRPEILGALSSMAIYHIIYCVWNSAVVSLTAIFIAVVLCLIPDPGEAHFQRCSATILRGGAFVYLLSAHYFFADCRVFQYDQMRDLANLSTALMVLALLYKGTRPGTKLSLRKLTLWSLLPFAYWLYQVYLMNNYCAGLG